MGTAQPTQPQQDPVLLVLGLGFGVAAVLPYLEHTKNYQGSLAVMLLVLFLAGCLAILLWIGWKKTSGKSRVLFTRWLLVATILALGLFFVGRDLAPRGSLASEIMGLCFYLTMGGLCIARYVTSEQLPVEGKK
jgi:hypothetical protein